ncbi:MAG: formylmethanofuran dehydrogenase subunit E family protein [Candidatus Helarchaeota archaeon]|mgnify:CR=1 FL=1
MKLSEDIKRLAEFHGHLGPYLIVGKKMGELSNELLGVETGAGKGHFHKRALVKTGTTPPISCIIDGIQYTSGCTLGKGNIEVIDQKKPEVIFTLDDKELIIKLKIKIDTTNRDLEEVAMEINQKTYEELFEIIQNF